jgi:hypothetical protein
VFILRIGSKKSAHVIKMPNFSSTFAKTFAHFWSKCANFVACFLYTGLTFAVNADYFTRRQFCVLVVLLDQCIVDKISLHTFNFYVTHVNAWRYYILVRIKCYLWCWLWTKHRTKSSFFLIYSN